MNTAKHTPGPWTFSRGELFGEARFYVAQSDGAPYTPHYSDVSTLIAETVSGERVRIQEANAMLIAAAPELLEVCKNLLTLTQLIANNEHEDIELVEFEIFSEITKSTRRLVLVDELAKARAAIAKATGCADSGDGEQKGKQ